jgi:hypothetical protein
VQELSRDYFFVHGATLSCIVRYRARLNVGQLKQQICDLLGGARSRQIQLGVLGAGQWLSDDGARLGVTRMRPGCCVRIDGD